MFSRRLLLALALALVAPATSYSQRSDLPKKELEEKTSSSLGQLRAFTEAKDYRGALDLIDTLISGVGPESFDLYVLSQVKAQILLTQGALIPAISPLEIALRLGEGNPAFLDPSARLEQLNLLAQLSYQEASELKTSSAQRAGYEKALNYIQRWLDVSPRATPEVRLFTASLLYQLGTIDPAKADEGRIREAITQAREGLLLSPQPTGQLYLILVACHLQLSENAAASELLEIMAQRDPNSSTTWSQLQSIYLSAAAETKDADEALSQNLRALHVLERAQAVGHLNTPRDHYTRVAILFNIQQYTRAATLLEQGLANGSLENAKRNWELLASAYQQANRDDRALDALTRASAKFPEDAALEFSLAQFLYNTGKVTDAYTRAESALAKGLAKPGQANIYLAYLAYELQRYDDAQRWVTSARATGDVPAATLDPLAAAISAAISQRESASNL